MINMHIDLKSLNENLNNNKKNKEIISF